MEHNPNIIRVSASSIRTLKACPIRYRNQYVYGVRQEADTDIQRVGTNWHECREVHALRGRDAVVELLNERYAIVPPNKDRIDWLRERAILLYSSFGYEWYYTDEQDYEVLATELEFELPLMDPFTGQPIPDAILVGKVDKLLRNTTTGVPLISEHKSTSRDVNSGSDYWSSLNLDTQTFMYLHAMQQMQKNGDLSKYGVMSYDPQISGCLYDAWHKPQIKPVKLSQADTKKFLVGPQHTYYETEFEVTSDAEKTRVTVDGVVTELIPSADGKKWAIRETADMFGCRLLDDIYHQPTKYFGRKPITHTTKQMDAFAVELFNLYREMKLRRLYDMWYMDETACEETFKCEYRGVCYNGLNILENIPSGFKGPYPEYQADDKG